MYLQVHLIELRLQEGPRIAGGEAFRHIALQEAEALSRLLSRHHKMVGLEAAAQPQRSTELQELRDAIESLAALQVRVGVQAQQQRPLGHRVQRPEQRGRGLAVGVAVEGGDEQRLRAVGGAHGDEVAGLQGRALHGGEHLIGDVLAGGREGLFGQQNGGVLVPLLIDLARKRLKRPGKNINQALKVTTWCVRAKGLL